jgi:hypothetical protein
MVACQGRPGTRGAEGRPGVGAGGSGCSVVAKSGSGPTGLWARAWLAAPNSTRAATDKRTSWRTHRTVDTLSPLKGHGQVRRQTLGELPAQARELPGCEGGSSRQEALTRPATRRRIRRTAEELSPNEGEIKLGQGLPTGSCREARRSCRRAAPSWRTESPRAWRTGRSVSDRCSRQVRRVPHRRSG